MNNESKHITEDSMNETSEDGSCLNVLDLFSGIGGFSLGLERTGGFKTVAFCEIEDYPRKVLNKHWPGVPIYEDVRELTAERLRADGIVPEVITGGFPCQDISVAGKQKGIEAERSGLWTELARLIGEIRPRYAIVENVTALLSGESGRWFQRVLGDLAAIGYDTEWHCIPASELGAHHHRDRVWIICYPQHPGRSATEVRESNGKRENNNKTWPQSASEPEGPGDASDTTSQRCKEPEITPQREILGRDAWRRCCSGVPGDNRFLSLSGVRRTTDGVSKQLDRLKGLGNAVVPQIPELIGRAILEEINSQS